MSVAVESGAVLVHRDAAAQIGGNFWLIDASADTSISTLIAQAPFAYASLFRGMDTTVLQHEAPYILHLDTVDADSAAAQELRQVLIREDAVIGMSADCDLDGMRRHWRKWMTVRLPEKGEKAMFRFCDARIMSAFLMMLSASEAQAFFGPVRSIHLSDAQGQLVYTLAPEAQMVGTMRMAPGTYYQITPVQMQRFEEVTGDTFKSDLFRFFRTVFPQQVARLDDAALRRQIELGLQDAERMGDLRPGSVLTVEAVRLLRPDIINSEWVWKEVMEGNELSGDPLMRAAILEAYLTSDFRSLDEREAYNAAIDRFWRKDFQ